MDLTGLGKALTVWNWRLHPRREVWVIITVFLGRIVLQQTGILMCVIQLNVVLFVENFSTPVLDTKDIITFTLLDTSFS